MKTISKVTALFAFALLITTPAFANKGGRAPSEENRASEDDFIKRYNRHVLDYVPSDIHDINQGPGAGCDEAGQPAKMTRENSYGNCELYSSASTNTRWKVRFIVRGTAERVFAVKEELVNGKKVDSLVLHVVFNPKRLPETFYVSPEAATRSAANRGSSPVTGMPVNPAPAVQPVADCSQISNFIARAQCIATNKLGAAIGTDK